MRQCDGELLIKAVIAGVFHIKIFDYTPAAPGVITGKPLVLISVYWVVFIRHTVRCYLDLLSPPQQKRRARCTERRALFRGADTRG